MAPAMKKRRMDPQQVQEITFDPNARQEFLTGFHKRKQARIQNAREAAVRREKEDKVRERKQVREQRKEELDRHIAEFNAELKKQNPDLSTDESDEVGEDEAEEWGGFGDGENAGEGIRQEDKYVDEDKYTTVTVEPMGLTHADSGDGAHDGDDRGREAIAAVGDAAAEKESTRTHSKPKAKKKKFRYESKAERQATRHEQRRKSKAARARREKGL